jgi:regulatory protein
VGIKRTRPDRRRALDPGKAADGRAIRAAAVAHLARRDFASADLAQKLLDQGYEREGVQAAVAELLAGGVLNDARYAEHFVSYHAQRGQGPLRIKRELRDLGLSDDAVHAALEAGPDWPALAREVRIRKFGLAVPTDWGLKARQARFLQFRGFSTDHIRAALGRDFDP